MSKFAKLVGFDKTKLTEENKTYSDAELVVAVKREKPTWDLHPVLLIIAALFIVYFFVPVSF